MVSIHTGGQNPQTSHTYKQGVTWTYLVHAGWYDHIIRIEGNPQ